MEINTNLSLKHYSYPSIEQFRNLIYNVNHKAEYIGKDTNGDPIYENNKVKPILKFQGTIKLHGTNAGIIIDFADNIIYYQSRENIICPTKDNAGFALHMAKIQDQFIEIIKNNFNFESELVGIYGEWCGGSIQKGVALNQLDKMFVIFNIAIIDKENGNKIWLNNELVSNIKEESLQIYNLQDFPTFEIDIDFNFPQLQQNKLIELTTEVEKSCPFAKQFGKEGIGEGIVWKCITPGYEDSGFWMKVKGEKHSSSKVKTIASVNTEYLNNIKEFVDSTVTENRCIQALSKIKESNKSLDRTCLGDYIRWIYNDIMKEELDTIVNNSFDPKSLGSPISDKARMWFFKNEINFKNII